MIQRGGQFCAAIAPATRRTSPRDSRNNARRSDCADPVIVRIGDKNITSLFDRLANYFEQKRAAPTKNESKSQPRSWVRLIPAWVTGHIPPLAPLQLAAVYIEFTNTTDIPAQEVKGWSSFALWEKPM